MFRSLAVVCSLSLLAGCQPAGPPLEPAAGVVTLGGMPLSGAVVSFIPHGGTLGQTGTAITSAEGKFEIKQPTGEVGLLAGKYKVVISKLVNPDGSDYTAQPDVAPMDSNARETLPPRYSSYEQTTLSAEVPAGGATGLTFDLRSK